MLNDLTKLVWSIVTKRPYNSTRLILPDKILPICRLDKLSILDFSSLAALDALRVTSTLFDNVSTDKTLCSIFLVHEMFPTSLNKNSYSQLKGTKNLWKLPALDKFSHRKFFLQIINIPIRQIRYKNFCIEFSRKQNKTSFRRNILDITLREPGKRESYIIKISTIRQENTKINQTLPP